jgi:hypothetical protein|tara:strand:+ start:3084 stop:3548 length:465 start_codon:yes stop_codon:yes gene_type:complete
MAVEHSTLTTTDLHEPKGVAAANADELYIANGSGSGAWTAADNNIYLQGTIADISTAGSSWIVSPCAGTITNIRTIINGAISGGDAAITFEINGTAITGGAITIANASSAAGDVDASTPTDNRVLAAGNKLEAITNGGSTNTIIAEVMYTITPL